MQHYLHTSQELSINSYLNVLSNSGRSDAATLAEIILEYLLTNGSNEDHFRGNENNLGILRNLESRVILKELQIHPDAISFSTTIRALANSNEGHNTGEKAEKILSQMIELSNRSEDGSLRPSESCYSGVISAWTNEAKINKDGSKYLDAESVLMQMEDEGYNLNTDMYNAILSIAGLTIDDESVKRNVASRARKRLLKMIEQSSNQRYAKPDVYSFNNIIKANIGFKEASNKRDAFFSSIDTFNALNKSNLCEANDQVYIQMFKMIQNTMENDAGRTDLCEELIHKCCEDGLMNNAVLRIIENILPSRSLIRLEACKKVKDKKLVVSNLPSEWSHNRRIGQNQRRNRNQSWRRS